MRKYNTEDIINRFEKIHHNKYGYDKFVYNGMHNKSIIKCPIHGYFEQTSHEHLKGNGCKLCANKTIANKLSYDTDTFIEKAKKVHGDRYDYSKTIYERNAKEVIIICPIHGEFIQKAGEHLNGRGCPKCGIEKRNNTNRNDINYVINKIKEHYGDDYIYDSIVYSGVHKKIKLVCKQHGEFEQYPSCLMSGKVGCPECAKEKKKHKINIKNKEIFINNALQIHGDKYDYSKVEYINSLKDVEIICPKHGSFWQTPSVHINDKCGCPECAKELTVSKDEKELQDFIKDMCNEVECNTRNILNENKELDIYVPDKKIAIEFDGLYWHNEKNKPDDYHLNKTKQCNEKGIQLIHIFEDEWINKQNIVKSRIKNILGVTSNKIYARKCEVKEISYTDCKEFLDNNHIQGNSTSKYRYGLYYNNELISIMTFSSPRKNLNGKNENGTFELVRFCNKIDTTVVGGASKLLKHFIREIKPMKIISYADKRWSNGNLYKTLGFKHIRDSRPSYFYVIGDKRHNRFEFRKDILVKEGYDANKTEHEIMLERNIYRIYDCGCMVYEMNVASIK